MAAPSNRKGCRLASMLHDARRVELSDFIEALTRGVGKRTPSTRRTSAALAATGCSARGLVPPLPTH